MEIETMIDDRVPFGFGTALVGDRSAPEPVVCVDGAVFALRSVASSKPASVWDVLRASDEERAALIAECRSGARRGVTNALAEGAYSLTAPLAPLARDVLCVGLNYAEHVREGAEITGRSAVPPADPIYFTKSPHAVIGPHDPIHAHAHLTSRLDYEVELAVVIGREGRDIPLESALEHVFGYAVFNDVSARDIQAERKQWYKGKSLDGTSPFGPWIVPAEVVGDLSNLELELIINGEVRQQASVRQMLVDVPRLIHDLSSGHTLSLGDVLATGTPAGCGYAMTPPRYLVSGDAVEASITGLGRQRNRVL